MNDIALQHALALRSTYFPTAKAHLTWENHIRYAREQTQFLQDVPPGWADALTFLSQQLGVNFLRDVKYAHPLTSLITGVAPWQVERLIQHAEILQYLAGNDPDYTHFLKKLRSTVDAKTEAMDFLLLGQILRAAGLQVRFPVEIPDQRNADMLLTDPITHEVLYAEISKMGESGPRTEHYLSYHQVYKILHECLSNPFYSAKQIQPAPMEYLATLVDAMRQLNTEVIEKDRSAAYDDRYFTITLYPLSQEKAFNAWLKQEDRRKGFNGAPLNYDDTARISRYKVSQEADQIPTDRAGIILIPVGPFHFWHQQTAEAERSFQYRLKNLPNIVGVFLFSEILHFDAAQFRFGPDDRFTRKQINGPLTRYSLFVRNEAFNLSIHPATHQKILSALE